MSCPLYKTFALTPPSLFFFFFFFFCFFKNLLRLKINILSSVYPEINFPAESVMKINNLSRPKVPGPPPLRIKWSSPYTNAYILGIAGICMYERAAQSVEHRATNLKVLVRVPLWARLFNFVFCRFRCATCRSDSPIQKKSSMTFIPGNICIERMTI